MMTRRILPALFTIFLFLSNSITAQNEELDLKNLEKILNFSVNENDSIYYYSKKLQNSKNKCSRLFGKYHEANTFYRKKEYNKCELILFDILNNIQTNTIKKNSKELSYNSSNECYKNLKLNVFRRLFYIKKNQNKYEEAYDYLIKRKLIVDSLPKKSNNFLRNKIAVNKSMATIKIRLGFYSEAKEILKQSISEINEISVNPKDIWFNNFILEKTYLHNILGEVYLHLANKEKDTLYIDSAEASYTKAYNITGLLKQSEQDFISPHYIRLARVNIARKKYSKALDLLIKRKRIIKSDSTKKDAYYLKAICFSNLKLSDSAIYYAKKKISEHNSNPVFKEYMPTIYNILAKEYHSQKKIDSAYKYSNLTIDEINKLDQSKKNTYQILKNDEIQSIKKLNSTLKKNKKNIKNQLVTVYIFSLLAFISLILYFLIKKKKQEKRIKYLHQEFKNLEPIKKNSNTIHVSDKLTREILNGLEQIENSKLFLDKGFNIYELSKILNTNTTYLSIVINKHKKKTFKHYLSQLRIDYLLKILEENKKYRKYSIKSLGEEIGYTNASAFTRAFYNYKNINPSTYLKNMYQGDDENNK